MKSQFKANSFQGQNRPTAEDNSWPVEGRKSAAPDDRLWEKSPTHQVSPGPAPAQILPARGPVAPEANGYEGITSTSVTELPTVKQPSFRPRSLPLTPALFGLVQHSRYGSGKSSSRLLGRGTQPEGGQAQPVIAPSYPISAVGGPGPVLGGPGGPGHPRITANLSPQGGPTIGGPGPFRGGPGPMPGGYPRITANLSPQGGPAIGGPGPIPGGPGGRPRITTNLFNQDGSAATFAGPRMGGAVMTPPAVDPSFRSGGRPPMMPAPVGGNQGGRNDGPKMYDGNFKRRTPRKKRKIPIWARVTISVLIVLLVVGAGLDVYYQVNFAGSLNGIVGQQVPRAKGEEDPNAGRSGDILSGPRINILLLGSDTDEKFQGQYIAQTDIVLTIDPASKTVGMLSIPRDFYLNVPGAGMHKLDEAYGLGGVKLSRLTIEQDFGITINYYAWVGLDGFIKVINEVGGVDVDVQHPIADDNYPDDVGAQANNPYALKRLYLAPGPQHLDGADALEYVRSRHADLVGDFGRSARQQQVLTALKTRLSNPDIFGKLSAIASDLHGYVQTDMQLSDVLKLMDFARSLDPNRIDKLVLGPPYSSSGKATYGADAGADVVFPNCDQIVPAISKMLQMGDKATCNVQGSVSGGPSVASTSDQPSSETGMVTGTTAQNLGDTVSNNFSGLTSGPSKLFGIDSLIDLLCLGVFESPEAFQL